MQYRPPIKIDYETKLLAVIGGVVGVLLAKLLLAGLLALYPERLPVSQIISIGGYPHRSDTFRKRSP